MEHKIYSILYIGILFFFNDTATTEIYTLSLHDALPIWVVGNCLLAVLDLSPARHRIDGVARLRHIFVCADRKSTRLNSSHANISYAVFCLKKKILEFCTPIHLSHPFTHHLFPLYFISDN